MCRSRASWIHYTVELSQLRFQRGKWLLALIYGNTVVIKPAEVTPKSVYHLVNAFHEAGIPAGVINCVFGKGSVVGTELTENPDIKADILYRFSNQRWKNHSAKQPIAS